MKRTWKKLFAFVCAFTLVAAPATFNGNSMWSGAYGTIVSAAENSTDYTITIPATLSVANAGWNAATPITAKVKEGDTFDSSKQLTVTASSENEWKLKSGENSIAYKIASATDQDKSYSDATAITSLKISADQLNNGTYSAPFGIVVDDYTGKPAGDYSDTVTFTAKVENAAGPLAAAFEDGAKFKVGYKWNRDGRNTTYLEFTNSGGTYSLTSISGAGQDGFNSSTLTVKDGNVLALDLVCDPGGRDDRMGEFEAQIEFDATYSTYKYSSKGELFTGIISVSVNDTDITNQLSEKTN